MIKRLVNKFRKMKLIRKSKYKILRAEFAALNEVTTKAHNSMVMDMTDVKDVVMQVRNQNDMDRERINDMLHKLQSEQDDKLGLLQERLIDDVDKYLGVSKADREKRIEKYAQELKEEKQKAGDLQDKIYRLNKDHELEIKQLQDDALNDPINADLSKEVNTLKRDNKSKQGQLSDLKGKYNNLGEAYNLLKEKYENNQFLLKQATAPRKKGESVQ